MLPSVLTRDVPADDVDTDSDCLMLLVGRSEDWLAVLPVLVEDDMLSYRCASGWIEDSVLWLCLEGFR